MTTRPLLPLGLGVALLLGACAQTPATAPAETVTVTSTAPARTLAPSPPATATTATTAASTSAAASGSAPAGDTGSLAVSFAALAPTLRGRAGVAVVPVGGSQAVVLGDTTPHPAWSTAKVPLAVAATEAFPDARTTALVHRAITASDNEAADGLWQRLGGGTAAAQSVDAVLAAGGDTTTRTEAARVAPPYSAFGQTRWSTRQAATFTAHLPCMPTAAPVLAQMRQVRPDQRWGLGALPGTALKGGWGPAPSGGYTVRQIAVVPTPDGGHLAVSAVVTSPGGFDVGVADLDRIATWLRGRLPSLSGGRCT